ncbi:FAD-binding protein [Pontibacter diazotrophicus]|uniref:FAD-binding protein n=1 Tax=Pontibacter diazotrophicus TaxID=1400979 RepID=A0A3D8LHL8_9BACT|nr:FAD-binding protein [Pontibacter diazotrophicus]RDV16930.1 FAD-binding protein [Pontibacter diazotrophicus]
MNNINWAGNISYRTESVHYPATVAQVQETVKKCSKIKALGSRHSFNRIADNTEHQISLNALNNVVSLDTTAHSITVEGGMRYGELAPYLHEKGYALPNLASLPHISIVGACATATHGSGVSNGNLATAVSAMELVNADGDIVQLSKEKDGEVFKGAVVSLGALGIVTKITLDLQPTFNIKQVVYRNLPMGELEKNFTAIMSSGYSVSLFTTWKNKSINQVWVKSVADESDPAVAPEFYTATLATQHMHPLEELSAEHATEQMGISGFWHERLPHFKMGFQPSAGAELQSEYFVPLEQGYEAMMAIEQLHEKVSPYLFVSEIRAIAADDLWMSPCYKKACVAFHFTWKQEWHAVKALLPLIEEKLAPYNAKPHWGKLFTMAPAVLQSRFPKLADFKQLVHQYDPEGKFRNEFLADNLYS